MECEEIEISVYGKFHSWSRNSTNVTKQLQDSNPKMFSELIEAIKKL
jgi:hypothetical protein